jgi:hypothetical protein
MIPAALARLRNNGSFLPPVGPMARMMEHRVEEIV